MSIIGKNIPHDAAHTHVRGESVYIDDMPHAQGELIVGWLGSPFAHGKVKKLDLSKAEKIPGVVCLLTHKDLHHNLFGPITQDEILLVEEESQFIGQPVVVIAAESKEAVKLAKESIVLEMEELEPILTINQAIAKKSFIDKVYKINRGDVDAAFKCAEHVLDGVLVVGGAEHFYFESQACIAYPGENNELVVHSSTQNPSEVQHVIAHLLGLKQSEVVVITKRMGGGFGGKECQATHPAVMASMVALRTKRAARLIFNKDDDMKYTGKRHPFQNRYKVAFDNQGIIKAIKFDLYADGGAYNDLSTAVIGRAITHSDNAYFIENAQLTGTICRTNLPPNTAFRGFGGPQGIITIENVMEEIAQYLNIDAYLIRERNLYGTGDSRNTTPYGQVVSNNNLPVIFKQLSTSCDYQKRRKEIDQFNAQSETHLKGIALTAVKFGISFTNTMLNQANALVNVYLDGSVQVSTGATEMGQGVNTNMRMLAAEEFGIPVEHVRVMATSTEKNNNTSATAASSATDLNGSATIDACKKIKQNIAKAVEISVENICFEDQKVFDKNSPANSRSFVEAVAATYRSRTSLGERGFYATKGIHFDWSKGQGAPFLYYTMGAAVSEVLIDKFTGTMTVERFDILMDIGKSINPGINRGQIAGAFMQGIGWMTNEELRYSDKGALLNHSPTTYKIPNINDIPAVFNIDTTDFYNTPNIRGTKAVGEPPLVLGISVFAAIKNALSYLSDSKNPIAALSIPATPEEILMRLECHYENANNGKVANDALQFNEFHEIQLPEVIYKGLRPVSVSVASAHSKTARPLAVKEDSKEKARAT